MSVDDEQCDNEEYALFNKEPARPCRWTMLLTEKGVVKGWIETEETDGESMLFDRDGAETWHRPVNGHLDSHAAASQVAREDGRV